MARVLLADSQPLFNEALEALFSRDDVHQVVGRCSSADDAFAHVSSAHRRAGVADADVCVQRDAKGLYAKALAGEIPHFTGVSDPYEPPLGPEVVLHTEAESVDESVHQVLAWLETHQLTSPTDR